MVSAANKARSRIAHQRPDHVANHGAARFRTLTNASNLVSARAHLARARAISMQNTHTHTLNTHGRALTNTSAITEQRDTSSCCC